MRDLLHDTALLVTSLSSGGAVRNAARFRGRCSQLADQLTDELAHRDCPEDVKREALLAQCGLLDEVALRYLPGEDRTAWETHPMQVERFSIYDAGRRVIDNVEARLHESSPDVELLEYYAAILGMGFMGRTVRESDAKRTALVAALDTRLQALRADVDHPFLTDTAGLRISSGLRRLAPWLLVALACIVAVAVWIAGSRVLDTQLAQIGPVKAKIEVSQR
ncbi:type VI secretion system protein ImpK [Paraburkholderia sp. HC6.4b]|uniref:DotU family type IV/VI secretion system protein n=1 Tax=unclassified Paraburkholderia TaxID=2615204 RepID=UPI0016116BB5|nr:MULTISPECIES: DotU family type IV/VI secretion system protein [unclassified Paraburkholderia]MBB5409228.1 type VI secretion system protein ImpK [Paraburkholderia sp. HC6.4b]MBB5450956.1 type VI secretion system protein ImpK [Paraburkholderia sp. Kb1A]